MRKLLLSVLACACACGMAWAYEANPEAGTIDAQKWYTINSKSRGGCLTATYSGALQHITEVPLMSYWRIIFPDDNTTKSLADGVYVRNFNGKYLTVAGISDTATKVYLGQSREDNISDNYYVICTAKDTNESGRPSANCIDASNANSSVSAWVGDNIDGFSWGFSLVDDSKLPVEPEVSTESSRKCYKVVSNRGISASLDYNSATYPGGFLQVTSETASASAVDEQPLIGTLSNGSYWYLTADEDGTAISDGVYLHNVISDQVLNYPSNPTKMTSEGGKVYLAKVTGQTSSGGSNQIFDLNTYAISKATLTADGLPGENTCMDQCNYSPYASQFVWSPVQEDKGDSNNGSSWYFLPATEEEVAAAEQGYLSSLPTITPDGVSKYSTPLTYCSNLSAIFDAEKVQALQDKLDSYTLDFTKCATVAEAISQFRDYKSGNMEIEAIDDTEVTKLLNAAYASAIGKTLQFYMQGTTHYLGVNSTGLWSYGNGKANVNTIWKVEEGAADGQYRLHNYGTDKYASKITFVQGTQVPVVATSEEAYDQYSFIQGGSDYNNGMTNMVRIFNNTTEGPSNNKAYFYCNGGDAIVSIWGNGHSNTVWGVSQAAFDEDATPTATVEDKTVTISLTDGTLAAGLSDAAISIIATKQDAEEGIAAADVEDTDVTASDDDNTASLTFSDYGTYTITIPAGYFVTADGAFTSEKSLSVTLTETTSISEIEQAADSAARSATYDLQGRRVARASKGLYIVNGKKTLVK